METIGIDHFHGYTKDVDGLARFFKEMFGLKAITWQRDHFGARGCIVTPANSPTLEFLEPTDPNGAIARLMESRNEGISVVDFRVQNFEEAIAEMESRGIKLIGRIEVGRVKQAWFESKNTFGMQIELSEYPGDDIFAAARMPGGEKAVICDDEFSL